MPTRRHTSQPETAIIAYSAVHTGPNSQEGGAHDGRCKAAYSVDVPVTASEPIRATAVTAAAKAARPSQRADVDCGGCAMWVVVVFPSTQIAAIDSDDTGPWRQDTRRSPTSTRRRCGPALPRSTGHGRAHRSRQARRATYPATSGAAESSRRRSVQPLSGTP